MKRATVLLLASVLLAMSVPAVAAPTFGVRGGFTFQPDQIHLGAHAKVVELAPGLMFLPNVEIGLGEDETLYAFNGELAWTFSSADWRGWRPYAGGGLGANIVDLEGADTRTDLGLNGLIGAAKLLNLGHEVFVELKLGLEDSPDAKLTIGLSFF